LPTLGLPTMLTKPDLKDNWSILDSKGNLFFRCAGFSYNLLKE
jgi:hypothetical protein